MFDLDRCKADTHNSLFMTYTITDRTFKATIMNLNSFPNVTKNKTLGNNTSFVLADTSKLKCQTKRTSPAVQLIQYN